MDSLCHVRNKIMYVLSWQTVSALTRVLFWCLFPPLLRNSGNKHQNNPLISTETVHHWSTYLPLAVTYVTLAPILSMRSERFLDALHKLIVTVFCLSVHTDGLVHDCTFSGVLSLKILHSDDSLALSQQCMDHCKPQLQWLLMELCHFCTNSLILMLTM